MLKTCFLISIVIGAIVPAIGQNDTIEKKFFYKSGKLSSQGNMYNGQPVGYWVTYYENGITKSEGGRKAGLLSGKWKFYNEGGNLITEISYESGKKNGLTLVYDDSTNLIREEFYENDVLHGKTREYFISDSIVKWVIPYEKGIKNGTAFEYASDGRLITIVEYSNGFLKKKEEINRKNSLGKQGTWREYFEQGPLHIEARYKNNVLHGYYKEYDLDGKLVTALLYIDGIVQENPEELSNLEVRKEYYDNGIVKWEGTYNYLGEKEGTFKNYNKKGDLETAFIYSKGLLLAKGKLNKAGERIEEWEFYYPDSSLRAKGNYNEGLRIDLWMFYHSNGKIEQKGKYMKGEKPHGDWIWYHPNGEIWREEGFWKGKEEGMAVEYNDTGGVVSKGEYIDGKKDGIWFYQMNDHKEEGKYIEGNRNGEWVYTFQNGRTNFKGSYVNGDPDGRHIYYYPNGKIKREEYYELGYEEGVWRSYDEMGNLILTSQWEGGREIKLDKKKVR